MKHYLFVVAALLAIFTLDRAHGQIMRPGQPVPPAAVNGFPAFNGGYLGNQAGMFNPANQGFANQGFANNGWNQFGNNNWNAWPNNPWSNPWAYANPTNAMQSQYLTAWMTNPLNPNFYQVPANQIAMSQAAAYNAALNYGVTWPYTGLNYSPVVGAGYFGMNPYQAMMNPYIGLQNPGLNLNGIGLNGLNGMGVNGGNANFLGNGK